MYRLGIDLGGTNIAVGVVDENFRIIGKASVKTELPKSAEEIADRMFLASKLACEESDISPDDIYSVGIGSPGAVDFENGTVTFSNNLGFFDVALSDMMKKRFGKKCFIANDANAAAYGEYIAGSGKGSESFILLTFGTGVGGGIILNGKIYSGFNFFGGELGHIVIGMNGEVCSCGRKGCYESYASATALIKQTKAAMLLDKKSKLWDICGGNIENVNGATVFKAEKAGDLTASKVVQKYIEYVAVGLTDIVNIFQPEKVSIGGGISNEGENFISRVRNIVLKENYARYGKKQVTVEAATLGNDAGIIGAAFLDKIG